MYHQISLVSQQVESQGPCKLGKVMILGWWKIRRGKMSKCYNLLPVSVIKPDQMHLGKQNQSWDSDIQYFQNFTFMFRNVCVHECVCAWMFIWVGGHAHVSTGTLTGQRHRVPIELESQLVIKLLTVGARDQFFVICALNCWAVFPVSTTSWLRLLNYTHFLKFYKLQTKENLG